MNRQTSQRGRHDGSRRSGRPLPEVVARLKGVLERFADALSCIDQCFIADDMLEQLPTASQVGKTIVGGIDLNKTRMRGRPHATDSAACRGCG